MLGTRPIGFAPTMMSVDMTLPATVFAAAGQIPVYTLEVFSPSTKLRIIAAATLEFITLPSDTLSNQPFNGRLDKALKYQRSIVGGPRGFGQVSSGIAELQLVNADGFYDSLISQPLDGARVLLKFGWVGASYDTYVTLLDGFSDNGFVDDDFVRLHVTDNSAKLEVPVQPNIYAGTGDAEGDSTIAGKRKPLAWGFNFNAPGLLIDPANLIYQVHDGTVSVFSEIRDRGVPLGNVGDDYANYAALVAAVIAAGDVATCKALGLFRLGAQADGIVTCSVFGGLDSAGAYIDDAAGIAQLVLQHAAASVQIDTGSLIKVRAAQPAESNIFIGPDDNTTVRQVLDELMGGIGGWVGFRRDGVLDMGILVAASGTSVASYSNLDFFEDGGFTRTPLPDAVDPPPWRQRAIVARNAEVQTDFAGIVGPDNVNLYKEPYRVAASDNAALSATIQAAHPRAQDPEAFDSCFSFLPDGVVEANRILSLHGSTYHALYTAKLHTAAFIHNIGDVVTLTRPRFDLAAGKQGVVVGTDDDTSEGSVTLTVFV